MSLFICAPDIYEGDAVGNHCLGLARLGERIGFEVELYAQRFNSVSRLVKNIETLFNRVAADDVLIVSYSIFDPFIDKLLELPCLKICYFHGVTDPALLREFEPQTAELCESGISQFSLLTKFEIIITNSKNSAKVLSENVDMGKVRVVPPVFKDMKVFKEQSILKKKMMKSNYHLLVVGRVVPHKRIEDAIKVLSDIRMLVGGNPKLSVVGSTPNNEYLEFLKDYASGLAIQKLVDFKGMIEDEELFFYYKNASALVTLSRHEGFCVPVLEAMHFGLPVFIRSGTAAGEIGNGVCIEFSELSDASVNIVKVLNDPIHYDALAKSGKMRVKEILRNSDDIIYRDILLRPMI